MDFLQRDLKLSNEFVRKNFVLRQKLRFIFHKKKNYLFKVLKYPWLLQIPSEFSRSNVQFIRDNLKGFDLQNGIKKCPEILMTDTANSKKLIKMFGDYPITIELINNCPAILSLSFDRFYNRYQSLVGAEIQESKCHEF